MKPAKYQRSTLMIIDKKEAKQFLNSGRGQYIVSQALFVAAKAMRKAMRDESPERIEHSNISDMDYLRENLFNAYSEELDQLIKGASNGTN